jgi:hypothetical protein
MVSFLRVNKQYQTKPVTMWWSLSRNYKYLIYGSTKQNLLTYRGYKIPPFQMYAWATHKHKKDQSQFLTHITLVQLSGKKIPMEQKHQSVTYKGTENSISKRMPYHEERNIKFSFSFSSAYQTVMEYLKNELCKECWKLSTSLMFWLHGTVTWHASLLYWVQ